MYVLDEQKWKVQLVIAGELHSQYHQAKTRRRLLYQRICGSRGSYVRELEMLTAVWGLIEVKAFAQCSKVKIHIIDLAPSRQ